jgi:hypothetical protein
MTGWRPFHRRSLQRFTLDEMGDVFLTACSLILLVVAASMDWCVSLVDYDVCWHNDAKGLESSFTGLLCPLCVTREPESMRRVRRRRVVIKLIGYINPERAYNNNNNVYKQTLCHECIPVPHPGRDTLTVKRSHEDSKRCKFAELSVDPSRTTFSNAIFWKVTQSILTLLRGQPASRGEGYIYIIRARGKPL